MKSIKKKQNTKTIIIILLCIFSLFSFCTIAYSAFSSTMNVTGIGYSRVETDVRITDFTIEQAVNATTQYEEFSKDTISSSISFKENGYIIYKIKVTNYGSSDVGIYSITGLSESLSYELIDYTIKEKLCDENNKCNNLAIKEFYIKISSNSNIVENINLKFQFEKFHSITYVDLVGNYPVQIMNNDSIKIDLSYDSVEILVVDSEETVNYTYENNILSLKNITCDLIIRKIEKVNFEFQYTGKAETLTIPIDGTYKVELWGAGGSGGGENIYGGYVSGNISLEANTNLYVYVGEKGKATNETRSGFNGGGAGDISGHTSGVAYSGGGATDIRLVSGTWNNFDSLKSRIMVAGGSGSTAQTVGGAAGGLSGYGDKSNYSGGAGTQLNGGSGKYSSNFSSTSGSGGFGYGGAGANYASGGGSGYYGGGGGVRDLVDGGGGGGSSFISGHDGCDAISESSTKSSIVHTYQSEHYSGYTFFNTKMIDGAGYSWTTTKGSKTGMPSHDGTSTMTGNSGNGYAKITLIDVRITYNIEYIGIDGNYQTEVYKGDDLNIDFKDNAPKYIEITMGGTRVTDYTYNNGILYLKNITGDIVIRETIYEYKYLGTYQTFNAPYNGIYKIELWGAGGSGGGENIYGGYVSGNISLEANTNLYVYVGEKGKATNETRSGFNGGGAGDISGHTSGVRYSGGGGTDIRLTSGTWSNTTSLRSRIMVAGGSGSTAQTVGGAAGGLSGYGNYSNYSGNGGTQTSGGSGKYSSQYAATSKTGSFGAGGAGANYGSGGGGGYYGGGGGVRDTTDGGGGGGSSFISGHTGCIAITSSSSTTPRNDLNGNKCTEGTTDITCSYHYSGYKFIDTIMIDGKGYNWTTTKGSQTGMPTHDGTSTMTGNTGNGYAKITLLEVK